MLAALSPFPAALAIAAVPSGATVAHARVSEATFLMTSEPSVERVALASGPAPALLLGRPSTVASEAP